MKWSDETVEAVGEIISYTMDIDFGCFHNRKETARVGKGEVERRKAIAGLHGCRLAARGEYCASCVIQATNYEYQGEEDRRSKPHDYTLSAKPVEVGELVEYLCCNTNLFSNDIEEAAQAILNKYNVTEKL